MSFKINENAAVTDIDGVVLDFDGGYRLVAEDILDRPVAKVCNSYSLRIRYGLSVEDATRIWKAMPTHKLGWTNLPLLPGADEALARLREMGFSIHSVTGIGEEMKNARIENLEKYNIFVDSMDCVGFGHSSKLEPLRRISPLMYFEDRLRLLYESDFVPHRVWVDHGDEQDGFETNASISQTTKLLDWVNSFEQNRKLIPVATIPVKSFKL